MSGREPEGTETVSVILATCNRLQLLPKCLDALERQDFDERFPIIVCDDGSSDGTLDFLREKSARFPRLHIVQTFREGPSAARNQALSEVKTPLVTITDDDTIPAPGWLRSHVNFLEAHRHLAGAGGRIQGVSKNIRSRYIDYSGAMHHPMKADGQPGYLVTANAAYRTSWLRKVNGFDPEITWPGGEDPDLSFRIKAAGGTLALNLDAAVAHHHRDSLTGIGRMFYLHGLGLAATIAAGTKKRDTSTLRVFGSMLRDGTARIIQGDLTRSERAVFAFLNLLRAAAFAAGFGSFRRRDRS